MGTEAGDGERDKTEWKAGGLFRRRKEAKEELKIEKSGSEKTDCLKKEHQPVVGLRGLKIDTGIEGDLGTRQRT